MRKGMEVGQSYYKRREKSGAGDGIRTRDALLGGQALFR